MPAPVPASGVGERQGRGLTSRSQSAKLRVGNSITSRAVRSTGLNPRAAKGTVPACAGTQCHHPLNLGLPAQVGSGPFIGRGFSPGENTDGRDVVLLPT